MRPLSDDTPLLMAALAGMAALVTGLAGADAAVVQAFGFNCVAFAVLAGKGA